MDSVWLEVSLNVKAEELDQVSARLIANKVSFKFKHEAIQTLYEGLREQVAAKEAEKK